MYNFKKIEEDVEKIWKKNDKEIKKSLQDNVKKPIFSFLEGPPTANAPPALHHLEVRTFKDIICKFRFMQGFSVPRKGGWDCHGLPVEVQVEKKLKLKDKKEILDYGVDKFINECKKSVFSNIKEWNESTKKLGYFIDLENPYITLDNKYIESVWWSLKKLYEKGFLYEGYKVVPFCPRCGTPLSSHEVAQGYKDVTEESIYIAFKLKDIKNEYILVWTTTPWTLPGNVALAVGKDIDYVEVELPDKDKLILGEKKLNLIKGNYKVLRKLKGKELVGLKYEPLYDIKELQTNSSHRIVLGDFVSTEEGTGIVHIAGMYGEDDYNLCKKENLPLIHTVGQDGRFLDIVPQFKGMFVKDSEEKIKEDLRKRHLLFKTEKITHSYPHCWRCGTPLLYYAVNSWFIKTTAIKDELIKLNQGIKWTPNYIKNGRFGKWLEGVKDWSLSRFKFWGTPLPIWECEKCKSRKVIGSIEELKENSIEKLEDEIELHKPDIDKIKLKCERCGGEMKRIPDVIDCWYDSGSATFAQFHYPFENQKEFERRFPYDFISEGIDQTRGWFYTLHVLGTLLFDKPAYKSVICAGHVVDENGEKMSKSKGNIIDYKEMENKVGVDAIRLQFCSNNVGNQKRFSYDLIKENVIPFLNVLYNCNVYYNQLENKNSEKNIEDKWILSKLNSLIKDITIFLEDNNISDSFKLIQDFVVKDLSKRYIRITREKGNKKVLKEILEDISKLLAPFAPYISEYIYSQFSNTSVNLTKFPKPNEELIDKGLEEKMSIVMKIIEQGLSERDKIKIGLKWPLPKAVIYSENLNTELENIIKNQLNVKELILKNSNEKEIKIKLDTNITPELEAEGYARVLSRKIQDIRKNMNLKKQDKVETFVFGEDKLIDILKKQKDFIKERTNSNKFEIKNINELKNKERFKNIISFVIKDKSGEIGLKVLS